MALLSAEEMAAAGVPVTFIAGDSGEDCGLHRSDLELITLGGTPIQAESLLSHGLVGLHNPASKTLVEHFIRTRDTPHTVYHLHNWSHIFSPSIFQALRPVASRLFMSAHDFSLVCPNLAYSNYQQNDQTCGLVPLSAACVGTHCDRRSYLHKLWRVARSVRRRLALDLAGSRALVGIIHPDMTEYFTRGGIPADRLRVVRNPVTPYSRHRIEAEANRDLFFVGRVVHEKGVDLAAEAARLTARRLRVIGDGDMREALAKRYPELVFEGWRTREQIEPMIREARALLVTSRLPETFTLVAHEAMRSGIPVVAFSDVDCREAAEIGAAIVVPPREPSSLADGIRRLDDDAAVARMSRIAFAEGARFSNTVETWRDAMLGHYADLLRQHLLIP